MRIEDRVRDTLSERLSKVNASEEAWTEIEHRLHHRPRVQAHRVAVAAFALLLFGVAFGGLWVSFHSEPSQVRAPEPASPAPLFPKVTGEVKDVGKPGLMSSIAYGAGSLWVSVRDGPSSGGTIVRMDPEDGSTLARIPVPVVPSWETGGGGLTVAGDDVWITGHTFEGEDTKAALVSIDASTNRVGNLIQVPGDSGADVAIADDSIWLLVRAHASKPTVFRIEPATGDVIATIPLGGVYGRTIVAAEGNLVASVAAASGKYGEAIDETRIFSIDPRTERVVAEAAPGGYGIMAGDGKTAWVTTDDGLVRIDPSTAEPVESHPIFATGDALAVGEGGVWFLDPRRQRSVSRLDEGTGEVRQTEGRDRTSAIAMAVTPRGLWAVDYDGWMSHVQLVPDCPQARSSWEGATTTLEPTSGAAGSRATISGPVPLFHKDGSYDGPDDFHVWWNVAQKDWEFLVPGGDAQPAGPGPVEDLGIVREPPACDFELTFEVPDAPPGIYSIVVIQEGGGGFGLYGGKAMAFEVTG
jgi:hypothetical protein